VIASRFDDVRQRIRRTEPKRELAFSHAKVLVQLAA